MLFVVSVETAFRIFCSKEINRSQIKGGYFERKYVIKTKFLHFTQCTFKLMDAKRSTR